MADSLEALAKHKPDWWFVRIVDEKEVEWIKSQGRRRNMNGKSLGWASKTSDSADDWHIAGFAGEWAASLAFNVPIGRIVSKSKAALNEGDLGGFIEVKVNRNKPGLPLDLVVNKDHLKPDRPYVQVLTFRFPEFLIVTGWSWGKEIAAGRSGKHSGTGHEVFILDHQKLRAPMSLFDELRKRDG